MITKEEVRQICEKYGCEYLVMQLAEECAELIHAALKLIRVRQGTTPVGREVALENYMEECGDVMLMLGCASEAILSEEELDRIDEIIDSKSERMKRRLLLGSNDQT